MRKGKSKQEQKMSKWMGKGEKKEGKRVPRPYARLACRQRSMSDARRYAIMTRSEVKVTNPSKLEILPFSKPISSAIYNGS